LAARHYECANEAMIRQDPSEALPHSAANGRSAAPDFSQSRNLRVKRADALAGKLARTCSVVGGAKTQANSAICSSVKPAACISTGAS
jgi:hypothetical protein